VRPGRDADHSPHLVPSVRRVGAMSPLPPSSFVVCSPTGLFFTILFPDVNCCNSLKIQRPRSYKQTKQPVKVSRANSIEYRPRKNYNSVQESI
jgi:hypothetical protein